MEASRQSSQPSREQIALPTIEGIDDFSQRLSLSRATTSTVTTDYRRPAESPPSAFGSNASPGACASTASTAVVGGNNPLPLVSSAPSVLHGEAAGSETGKVKAGAADEPEAPLSNHYDAVIFHDVRDLERAELFRRRLLSVLGSAGEDLRLSVFGCQADVGRSYYDQLEDTVRRSTYLMLFVTRNLCEDRVVGALLRDQLLSEMLENRDKRWCLIPIWTEPEEEYSKPMALRPLVGIAEKSMSDKLRRESVVRLFTDKRSSRLLREKAELEQRAKEGEQKLQKWKDEAVERQHRERLQQLNEVHQRELRNAQREAELARQLERNALARREEENSATVGNQLMQMQFIQQNARHARDQLILEEWQRDMKEQARAMTGCSIPGGAPSVLRPRGGNAPLISDGDGGQWISTVGPDGRAYVALAACSDHGGYFIPAVEQQLPYHTGSPASFSPLTVSAARATPGTGSWASEQPLLPPSPPRPCTAEETLRQAHDLLQQLNLTRPQTPTSVDPQPPPYSQLYGSPADVLPSHIHTGPPPWGKNALPTTGVSAIRHQEKKPQPLPDIEPRKPTPVTAVALETKERNRTDATLWPTKVLGDTVSTVEDIRKNQQALLLDCAEQQRAWLPQRPPATSALSISSGVQHRSEDRSFGFSGNNQRRRSPEQSSGLMSELPAYGYSYASTFGALDTSGWQSYSRAVQPRDATLSSVADTPGSQSYSRAVQPRDATLSSVANDTYTSSEHQPLRASHLQGLAPAAAGHLPVDPRHQSQLPPGIVALRVEDFNNLLCQLQTFGNVYWPFTGVPLQQQMPPPGGLPFSHAGAGRLPQSQSMPAYLADVAGNASAANPRFCPGQQQLAYSSSSPMLSGDAGLDHRSANRSSLHVDSAEVPGRATSHGDAASPRAADPSLFHRQSSSQCMPVSTQCTDTGSRHRSLTGSQPSSWTASERDSSFGSGHYPATRGSGDASLGTGSSSAGSLSSGPSSAGTGSLGSGGDASSLDSGHGPATTALQAWPSSLSSAGGPGNIPLTVLEQLDSTHGAEVQEVQPLTLHPTH